MQRMSGRCREQKSTTSQACMIDYVSIAIYKINLLSLKRNLFQVHMTLKLIQCSTAPH